MWPIDRLRRAEPLAVPADKPLALVEAGPRGLLITAVTARAAREGVHPGLTLADARAAFPALQSRRAEADKDRAALLKLARWAGRYGPNRHIDGDDGLWIDITGVAHLFGGEAALLDDLVRRLTRFGVSAQTGLADTIGAAHALARYGVARGQRTAIALAGETKAALATLPVESLRLETSSVVLLRRLGLRRVGDLYDLPRDSLARRFRTTHDAGRVLTRLDQALGVKTEPRRPLAEPPVLSVVRNFSEPLMSSEALLACVADLCGEMCALLASKALGARAVRLSLFRADGTVAEAFAAMSAPSREAAHILRLLNEKVAGVDAGFGIDLLRLDVVRAESLGAREVALEGKGMRLVQSPALLIDRLSNRLGAAAITFLRPRASHIPERAEVRVTALASAGGSRLFDLASPLSPGGSGGNGADTGRVRSQSQPPPIPPSRPSAHQGARRRPGAPLPLAGRGKATAESHRAVNIEAGTGSVSLQAPLSQVSVTPPLDGPAPAYEPPWPYACAGPRRPPFLLARPEPIDVIAEVPDGPPARFTWRRVERRVARADGPERLAPEWWQHLRSAADQKPARPRDYYTVEDETGATYWVFRHGLYGRDDDEGDSAGPPNWFLHGLFA